jgi:hypothetical protein
MDVRQSPRSSGTQEVAMNMPKTILERLPLMENDMKKLIMAAAIVLVASAAQAQSSLSRAFSVSPPRRVRPWLHRGM